MVAFVNRIVMNQAAHTQMYIKLWLLSCSGVHIFAAVCVGKDQTTGYLGA